MRVRKSIDDTVAVMIPRTSVPASINARIRTQLHHSEWSSCTGKSMAMPVRADHGINILREFSGDGINVPVKNGTNRLAMIVAGRQRKNKCSKRRREIIFHVYQAS